MGRILFWVVSVKSDSKSNGQGRFLNILLRQYRLCFVVFISRVMNVRQHGV